MGNLITGTTVGGCCSKCVMASKGDLWGQWRPITWRDPSVDWSLCLFWRWRSFCLQNNSKFSGKPPNVPAQNLDHLDARICPHSRQDELKGGQNVSSWVGQQSVTRNKCWVVMHTEEFSGQRQKFSTRCSKRNSQNNIEQHWVEMGQRDAWVGQQPVTSEKCWVGMQRLHTDCTVAIHTLEFSGQTLYPGCSPTYFS